MPPPSPATPARVPAPAREPVLTLQHLKDHNDVLTAAHVMAAIKPDVMAKYFAQLAEIGGHCIQGNYMKAALLLVQDAMADIAEATAH